MKRNKLLATICSMFVGVIFMIVMMLMLVLTGVVSLNRVDIVISTTSAQAVYDGKPLTNHNWSISQGNLKTGHRAVVTFTGSQTNVGQSSNTVKVTIFDALDADVTSDYSIDYDLGTLSVLPRELTVESFGAEKVYDRKVLTNPEYTVSNNLASGENISVKVSGSIINIGQTANTISSIVIKDKYGNVTTNNYRITVREGMLRITDENGNYGGGGSGLSGSGDLGGGAGAGESDSVLYTVYSDYTGRIYLKSKSFGSFTGNSWQDAKEYTESLGKFSAMYLTSYGLHFADATKHSIKIKSNSFTYVLPYYMSYDAGDGYNVQESDVEIQGDATEYELDFFIYNKTPVLKYNTLRSFEIRYREYVEETYLDIDGETLRYMKKIIYEQGFDASDPDIVSKVASYIQGAAKYDLHYDTAMDEESNVVIAFLNEYKSGVCRHYASAAVLLYRALGIPARYTVGIVADAEANKWVDVPAANAHAWAEVYLDGIGWVQVEVTGGGVGGGVGGDTSGEEEKDPLNIYPVTVEKYYDGKPLYAKHEIIGFEDYLEKGYTYKVKVNGSRTELGISQSKIEYIEFFDPNGVNVTDEIEYKLYDGKIHVYDKVISFTSRSASITYGDNFNPRIVMSSGSELAANHSYTIKSTVSLNVGNHFNTFDVTITDGNGKDVTDEYKINKTYGIVSVAPANIKIKASDASKPYDGKPLTCDSIELISGSLAAGDRIKAYSVEGTITNIGRTENVVTSVIILNADNKNVTGNYVILLEPGTLRVTIPTS